MDSTLVLCRAPPELHYSSLDVVTKASRELEDTHGIRWNGLGHSFNKNFLPPAGQRPLLPACNLSQNFQLNILEKAPLLSPNH